MKILSKKKNPIKAKKQKLINRINSCRTLKELEQYERTLSYHEILKDNYDWDYDFLIDLIEFKLKRMAEYFHTHRIVENEELYAKQVDKAIAILNAGYKTDIILSKDLYNYVNERNLNRFIPKQYFRTCLKDKNTDYYKEYGLATIREYKAKALFWKYLHHYIELWWE